VFILIDIENSPKLLSWLLIVRNQVLEAKESKVDNSFFFLKINSPNSLLSILEENNPSSFFVPSCAKT
jgi:hypothetical protein